MCCIPCSERLGNVDASRLLYPRCYPLRTCANLPLPKIRPPCLTKASLPHPTTLASLQSDLRQAATAARIAYCAAVLEQQAEPMLAALAKAGSKASGGKKGGKAAAGKAAGAGSSKAAAAAGSRPVSRANSTANLEAAAAEAKGSGKGSGKAAAASGKRRAPPLPDNMRQTRSRH